MQNGRRAAAAKDNQSRDQLGAMEVTIVQMDEFFLYLPLYYAARNKFFGFIPERYNVRIDQSAVDHTDVAAFRSLMDQSQMDQNVHFAICDPMVVLDWPITADLQQRPVVLAGLITNAAFWAVDHNTYSVRDLRDLGQYERIIAFKKGTTSYGIASRIARQSAKAPKIEPVEPGAELRALSYASKGAVAISPNLLEIEYLIWKRSKEGFCKELALGTTSEYSNVLVTALLTRADVVRDHPDLVKGLVTALDRATQIVRSCASDVVSYAADKFNRVPEGITLALESARQAQVFPPTLEISWPQWERAAEAFHESRGLPWDTKMREEARSRYDTSIAGYGNIATEAHNAAAVLPNGRTESSMWQERRTAILLLLFSAGFVLGSLFPGVTVLRIFAPVLATILAGWGIAQYVGASLASKWGRVYIVEVVVTAAFFATWRVWGNDWKVDAVVGIAIALVVAWIPTLAEASKASAEEGRK